MTPRTVACQASLSMGFSRQEYWSGLLFLSPGDLPDPGIEPVSPALAGRFFTTEPPGKPETEVYTILYKHMTFDWKDMMFFSPKYKKFWSSKSMLCCWETLPGSRFCPLHWPLTLRHWQHEEDHVHPPLFQTGIICLFQTFCNVGGWWGQGWIIRGKPVSKKDVCHLSQK